MAVTQFERTRCQRQLAAMNTTELKELAEMLECENSVENEALTLALSELRSRGVHTENIKIMGRADAAIEYRP